jgi:hypothetical protein
MPGDDGLESHGIQRACFDELEEAGLVLRPAGLQRDGGEVFGCKAAPTTPPMA